MQTPDPRKAPRAPIELKVEYRRVNAFIADFTRDVSREGLFVRTDHPLEVGTECYFTIHLPALGDPLTLLGEVRRVVPPGGEGEAGMGVSLKFGDDAERDALRQVVDGLMVDHLGRALFDKLMRVRNREASTGEAPAE